MDELIKGDEIVTGKRVKDVLHTPQCGYVYGNGIYNTIERHGSSTCAATLVIYAVNGTQLAEYNGISDFTANGGAGAPDFEMLCI
jgi:hypothetical protein